MCVTVDAVTACGSEESTDGFPRCVQKRVHAFAP